jgi:large subunit ribosomal protein L24
MAAVTRPTARTKVPEIRKGDEVIILVGKDAGKRGQVERVIRRAPSPTSLRSSYRRTSARGGTFVVVSGLNIAKRHTKPRPLQSSTDRVPRVQQGGILDIPQPLPASRVMVVCGRCDKPTRIGHETLGDGKRIRICQHCNEPLEVAK